MIDIYIQRKSNQRAWCSVKYLWTEDTGAGYHFWKLVNQHSFKTFRINSVWKRVWKVKRRNCY